MIGFAATVRNPIGFNSKANLTGLGLIKPVSIFEFSPSLIINNTTKTTAYLGRVAGSAKYTVDLYPNPTAPLTPLYPNPTAPLTPLYPKSPVGETGRGKTSPGGGCGASRLRALVAHEHHARAHLHPVGGWWIDEGWGYTVWQAATSKADPGQQEDWILKCLQGG
jgi:hypothetical protein